jgi:endonuclease/exonuclease/phosphatase family metal-dependent hydrolase
LKALGQVTVGTYNILHPEYAEKYLEPEGVNRASRKSNWNTRAPAIGRILQGGLDVMFLQEVGREQLADLEPYLVEYDFKASHMVHPGRSDGVVVLTRKARFKVISTHPVKLPGHKGQCYMYAAAVVAHDLHNNVRLLLASVHFYKKQCIDPQGALLTYLATAQVQHACDYVVWGGDCNTDYTDKVVKYSREVEGSEGQRLSKEDEFKTAEGVAGPTRPSRTCPSSGKAISKGKRIDWIFASSSLTVERCAATEAFKRSTMCEMKATGWPPSDHYGEAVVVKYRPHSDQDVPLMPPVADREDREWVETSFWEGKIERSTKALKKKRRDEEREDREWVEDEERMERMNREWVEASSWEGKLELSTRTPRSHARTGTCF